MTRDTVLDMDTVMVFYPLEEGLYDSWIDYRKAEREVAVVISDEFLERYAKAKDEYFACSAILEHAYRKQEGMTPLLNCPEEWK